MECAVYDCIICGYIRREIPHMADAESEWYHTSWYDGKRWRMDTVNGYYPRDEWTGGIHSSPAPFVGRFPDDGVLFVGDEEEVCIR